MAARFCGRERLLGIPLPSMPLALGIIVAEAFFYNLDLSVTLDSFSHRNNILLVLLIAYAMINGQSQALWIVVSAVAVSAAVSYSLTIIRLMFVVDYINETQEYLYSMICLWYVIELLTNQGQFRILARIPGSVRQLAATLRPFATQWGGAAVCVVTVAASIMLALSVYLGGDYDTRQFESIYEQVADRAPVVRADFDIYAGGRRLYYIKEDCTASDIADRFFLHIYPVQRVVLSADRQQHGYANLDFNFADLGKIIDEKCAALINLPRYPIDRIITGQYIQGEGRLWEVEFAPPAP